MENSNQTCMKQPKEKHCSKDRTNAGFRKRTNIGLREEDKHRTQRKGQTQDSERSSTIGLKKRTNIGIKQEDKQRT